MDNNGGLVGEIIEKGQVAATGTKNVVSDVVSSAQGQVGFPNEKTTSPVPSQSWDVSQQQSEAGKVQSTQRTTDLVQDFYAPSDENSQTPVQRQEQIDTDQQLVQVRQKLHQELHNEVYFNELNNPPKEEEEVADKIEREDREKMEELELSESKKPDDSALRRAQTVTERNPGVAG